MVLRNKLGSKKEFNLLYKIELNNQNYLVYEDVDTHNIYASIYNDDKLSHVEDEDIHVLEEIVSRIEGRE